MRIQSKSDLHTAVAPVYTGQTPIATCHWQSLANIFLAQGLSEAWLKLGLSWGCRWDSREILFGSGRWRALAQEIFGLRIDDHFFPDRETAERFERDLSERSLPFVAEIDAFYVPCPYENSQHVVHTVIVLERSGRHASLLDTTNTPRVVEYTIERYLAMREAPCAGRLDQRRLYASWGPPRKDPSPSQIAELILEDLRTQHGRTSRCFEEFICWIEATRRPINVCRAAAERFQARLTFAWLADAGVTGAAQVAALLQDISDQFYMVHVLAAHPSSGEERPRRRIARLVRDLAEKERFLLGQLFGTASLSAAESRP